MMEIYGLMVPEGRSWQQGVGRTVLPPGARGDNSGEASFSICGFKCSLARGSITPTSASHAIRPFPLCLKSPSASPL